MQTILIIIFSLFIFFPIKYSLADENLAQKLSGRILLQVQSHGEAWYINPADFKRYYLGRPQNAFDLMRQAGTGITNSDLNKIAVGIIADTDDDDGDGLGNSLENALGTDPEKTDSDNDGFSDKNEIENNYNPLGAGKYNIDNNFAAKNAGKIFLQVEKSGEAWYINPVNLKRYFLGRPADAFAVMRSLSLGITDNDIAKAAIGQFNTGANQPVCLNCQNNSARDAINAAADAIRSGKTEEAISYFTADMQKAIEYTMNFLNDDGKLTLGNILSGAKLFSSTDDETIYNNEVYFSMGGYEVLVKFILKKQNDGKWLMTNL